jgi:hypothetical protein
LTFPRRPEYPTATYCNVPGAALAILLLAISATHGQTITTGTTIAIVKTAQEVSVSADSKVSSLDSTPVPQPLTCKISSVDSLFYVSTGIYAAIASGYHPIDVIRDAIHGAGSFRERVERARAGLVEASRKFVRAPDGFEYRAVKGGLPPLVVYFFGTEGDSIFLAECDVAIITSRIPDVSIRVIYFRGDEPVHLLTGDQQTGDLFMARYSTMKPYDDPIKFTRTFVGFMITHNDSHYGAPVHTVQITNGGVAVWLDDSPLCAECGGIHKSGIGKR